jgi:DnaJ family protein B protein 12
MESNKDDSIKCIHVAEQCIKTGDIEKAIRFLNKAERLYPSERAKNLLHHLTTTDKSDDKTDESPPEPGRRSTPSSPHTARKRERRDSHKDCHELQPKYSQEQLEAVRKIRKCKDYYEILGLSKDCSDDDLKKAYKKLALKFHPDKNHAPGATEAFKAIGNAFAVLSDQSKRRRYDEFGSEEETARRCGRHSNDYDYSRGFEGDISAEDLFRMFFGGNVFTQNHPASRPRPTAHNHTRQQNENPYLFLIQLSPLILIILLSLLSSLLVGQSPYSLRRDAKYTHERKTHGLGVTYYVRSDFTVEANALSSLERQVEEDYLVELQQSCYRERNNRDTAMWRAQMYGNTQMYNQAKNMRMTSCERLRAMNAAGG